MNNHITLEDLKGRIKFRFAEPEDVSELVHVYSRFYNEAVYKDYLELDLGRVYNTLHHEISANMRPHILALDDGDIVGFIAWFLDHSFSVKPCMVMLELYVIPEYRKGAIGRGLVSMAIVEGKVAGAGAIHAPVASGMQEASTLRNLFGKAGFEQFGWMLRRKL